MHYFKSKQNLDNDIKKNNFVHGGFKILLGRGGLIIIQLKFTHNY